MVTTVNAIRISMVEIPISYGEPVKVLVPESLFSADRPLAIRLKYKEVGSSRYASHIQVWTWDLGTPLASANFMTAGDDTTYSLKKGTRLRRHFGTVFDSDGNAIHLLSLYKKQK